MAASWDSSDRCSARCARASIVDHRRENWINVPGSARQWGSCLNRLRGFLLVRVGQFTDGPAIEDALEEAGEHPPFADVRVITHGSVAKSVRLNKEGSLEYLFGFHYVDAGENRYRG